MYRVGLHHGIYNLGLYVSKAYLTTRTQVHSWIQAQVRSIFPPPVSHKPSSTWTASNICITSTGWYSGHSNIFIPKLSSFSGIMECLNPQMNEWPNRYLTIVSKVGHMLVPPIQSHSIWSRARNDCTKQNRIRTLPGQHRPKWGHTNNKLHVVLLNSGSISSVWIKKHPPELLRNCKKQAHYSSQKFYQMNWTRHIRLELLNGVFL
jgi:hypothetical protein